MQRALMGCIATVERDEAPRRQPESLANLKATSLVGTHTARDAERKANRTNSVDTNEASARPYSTVGHVTQALKGVSKLLTLRYGRRRVPAAEARDVYRVRAMLEARALALDPDFVGELEGWSKRRLCLDAIAKAEICQEVAADAVEVGPLVVGYLLHLRDAERDAVQFWRAVAVDMTDTDRVEKHRADDAARKRRSRAAAGIPARGVRFAEARARDPYASRATLYRRIKSGKGAADGVSR